MQPCRPFASCSGSSMSIPYLSRAFDRMSMLETSTTIPDMITTVFCTTRPSVENMFKEVQPANFHIFSIFLSSQHFPDGCFMSLRCFRGSLFHHIECIVSRWRSTPKLSLLTLEVVTARPVSPIYAFHSFQQFDNFSMSLLPHLCI